MELLTVGNAAKLYCLCWIENLASTRQEITILDLGCGTALNFVKLLELYPKIRYLGVEPDRQSCLQAQSHLRGLNGTVVNAYAYGIHGKLQEEFDVVVSFSVLEHVYRRKDYLQSAKECLKPDGHVLINYDSGHFVSPNVAGRWRNLFRPVLARLGAERYYQGFVKEIDFRQMAAEVGFEIVDAKFFNTHSLKSFYKTVPQAWRSEYMHQWLEFELGLNELGMDYVDSLASCFGTRNFVLVHRQPVSSPAAEPGSR